MPPEEDDLVNFDLDQLDVGDPEGEADEKSEDLEESDGAPSDEGAYGKERKGTEAEKSGGQGEIDVVSRGQKRHQKLANELKAERDRGEARDRELAELRAKITTAAVDPELERQRIALMTPEERMQHQLDQGLRTNERLLHQMQAQNRDIMDKAAYDAAAAKDNRRAKLSAVVENVYQEQARAGRWVPRETVYYHELGKLVASQMANKKPLVKKEGEERMRRQQASLGSGRGDVSPERGKGSRSFEDRYGDVLI